MNQSSATIPAHLTQADIKRIDYIIGVMQAYKEGKPIEVRPICSGGWEITPLPAWNWGDNDYRVAVTKPSINWDHVAPEYVAMATDFGNITYLFKCIPAQDTTFWRPTAGEPSWTPADSHASFVPGTCDWKDSLVLRPAYKE